MGDKAVDTHELRNVARGWRPGNPPPARLQPDQTALTGRDADRPTTIARVSGWNDARTDRCGRSAARPTRGVFRVPRIACPAVRFGLSRGHQAELGGVCAADEDQARLTQALCHHPVLCRTPVDVAQEARAGVVWLARLPCAQILQQEWHAAERPRWWRRRLRTSRGKARVDHSIDLIVGGLDPGDRLIDQLGG